MPFVCWWAVDIGWWWWWAVANGGASHIARTHKTACRIFLSIGEADKERLRVQHIKNQDKTRQDNTTQDKTRLQLNKVHVE